MSGAGFTPGPWSVEGSIYDGMAAAILSPTDPSGPTNTVAHILNGPGSFANARLIAAAPDLYRVLANAVAQYDAIKGGPIIGALEAARSVLAKARGDQ